MRVRVLAPAGGFATPRTIFNTWKAHGQQPTSVAAAPLLEGRLQHVLGVTEAIAFGSGKDALSSLFSLLPRTKSDPIVGISAYTCPDIAAAAIASGCRVLPLEVIAGTFEPDPTAIPEELLNTLSAVVLSNLYGIPDSPEHWQKLLDGRGILLIDDACQASLSSRKGVRVGTAPGTAGVLSFGRGKSICGAGGGAVILNPGIPQTLGVSGESIRTSQLPSSSSAQSAKHLLLGAASWLLERPSLYGLVAAIPGLKLGQTHCELDWHKAGLSNGQALHVLAQLEQAQQIAAIYLKNAKQWSELLATYDLHQPYADSSSSRVSAVVPIRYPVLLKDRRTRDAVFAGLDLLGLGATVSYPCVLQGFNVLTPSLLQNATPLAEEVSGRILTLPVHQYVRRADIESAAALIGQICGHR